MPRESPKAQSFLLLTYGECNTPVEQSGGVATLRDMCTTLKNTAQPHYLEHVLNTRNNDNKLAASGDVATF